MGHEKDGGFYRKILEVLKIQIKHPLLRLVGRNMNIHEYRGFLKQIQNH